MKAEIQRIFGEANQTATFDPEQQADKAFNLDLTTSKPTKATILGETDTRGTVVTNIGRAYVTQVTSSLADIRDSAMASLGVKQSNIGRALGRVGAHEAGHYLLQLVGHKGQKDLMKEQFTGNSDLFRKGTSYNKIFKFTAAQMQQLSKLCPPKNADHGDGVLGSGGHGFVSGDGFRWLLGWWERYKDQWDREHMGPG